MNLDILKALEVVHLLTCESTRKFSACTNGTRTQHMLCVLPAVPLPAVHIQQATKTILSHPQTRGLTGHNY